MPGPVLDFWFDFASTYSYLTASRIGPLAAEAGVEVRFRPFLLGRIFKAQGWDTSPFNLYPAKGRNMWRDLERVCEDTGLPFRRPVPFPQNSLLPARVAIAGMGHETGAGWGKAFSVAVYRAQFAEGRRIDEPATLEAILSDLNIDAKAALEVAQSDANKQRLRAQTEEAQRLGVFGAPTFITAGGELFWGNDRLEQALRWARRGA
ncbi:MAG TPA: 2-hydroxychromene-2-carboxylate isomerase [Xanthobacteraceae bacterium]